MRMHCWLIGSYLVWRKSWRTSIWWRHFDLSSTPEDWSTEKSSSVYRSVPIRGHRLPAATLPRQPERGRGGGRRGNPRRGGTGRGAPPAHPRPIGNQLTDPAFRAQLTRIIQGEIEWVTGRTPWNDNREHIPSATITQIRLDQGIASQALVPHVNRVVTEACTARAENEAENQGAPQNDNTDMRTLILNFLIIFVIINFVLNILLLYHILNIWFL